MTTTTTTRAPGIYDIPAAEYHRDTWALSASMLKDFASDSLKFEGRYRTSLYPRKSPTRAMEMGTLIHALALEPSTAFEISCVVPDELMTKSGARSSSKEAVAWHEDAASKGLLTFTREESRMATMAAIVVNKYLTSEGVPPSICKMEQSIYWQDGDLDCRARLDIVPTKNIIIDLKCMASAHPSFVERQVSNLKHWMQQAHYSEAFNAQFGVYPEFLFLVVEPEYPFNVNLSRLTPRYTQNAMAKRREYIARYKRCIATGDWRNDWSKEINYIDCKPWTFETVSGVEA